MTGATTDAGRLGFPGGYALRSSPIELKAELEPDIPGARVLGMAPVGIWLSVVHPGGLEPGRAVRVSLKTGLESVGPFAGRAGIPVPQRNGTATLYVGFESMGREQILAAAAFMWSLVQRGLLASAAGQPLAVERIISRDRIDAVLRGLRNREARLTTVSGNPSLSVQLPPLELVDGNALPLRWPATKDWPEPPFIIEGSGLVSSYSFPLDHVQRRQRRVLAAAPRQLLRTRNRVHRRLIAPPGWLASFPHPLWPDETVRCRLHDVSIGGLSLACGAQGRSGLFPGLLIPHLRIERPGAAPLSFTGRIAHHSPDTWLGHELHGMAVTPASAADHAGWMDALGQAGSTRTHRGAGWQNELWTLYRNAGYFEISGPHGDFERLRPAFDESHAKVAAHPEIGVHVVWPTSRGIEASLSMLRVYSGTWLAYQLARQRLHAPTTPRGAVLREVITDAFEHPYRDPDFRWYLVWIPKHAAFTKRAVLDFTDHYADDRERVARLPFRAWMLQSDDARASAPGRFVVGAATPGDIALLLETIQETRPLPYVEAHDFVSERFDLEAVRRAWTPTGLRRERGVLIARRGKRAVAAAVLEMASEGLHLFGLLSTVRVFALARGGESARAALLEAARAWYRSRGLPRFVYFAEDDLGRPPGQGADDLGEADLVVVSVDLVPDQIDYAWEITQSREPPRRNIAEKHP